MTEASSAPLLASFGESLGPFASRFHIEAALGAGGYGTVVRALDRRQGKRVALKIPHAGDTRGLLAIKREFRVLAGVSHPNLVAFHELFVADGAWFFSMELVRGMDCAQWIERAGVGAIPDVLGGLASGLAHLHAMEILHGDLKPSNAWVDAHGTPLLLDFGLARHRAHESSEERVAGTLPYLAPELFAGGKPSAASDLYALGVLAYELVTGRPAFTGTAAEIMGRKVLGPDIVVEGARAGVSDACIALVEGMLARDPQARPSASDVIERSGRASRHVPSLAPQTLLGRERELDALLASLGRAEAGVPELVFLEGPAGIGKTTLLDHFATRATRGGAFVSRSRCSEHEAVPFQALDGIVDGLAARLVVDDTLRDAVRDPRAFVAVADLFPVFDGVLASCEPAPERRDVAVSAPERRRLAARALAEVLVDLSRARPLVLVIDDAHWADEDGARLLEELLEAVVGAPVMIVIGHRSGDHGEPLAILRKLARAPLRRRARTDLAHARVTELSLAPLSESDAQLMLGARQGAERDALVLAAGGSPFLLETLALLEPRAIAANDAAVASDWLERAVIGRLDALAPDARLLLEAVCVAGHPIPHDLIAASLGVEVDLLALKRLGAARLVRTAPVGRAREVALEPYHDHLRRIVRARIGDEREKRLHRAMAKALANRTDADPMWICLHLRGAGELVRAARHAAEGAQRAARALAFAQAADLFGFAIEHHEGDAAARRTMEIARAEALANAGRGRDAAEQYTRAAEGADVADRHDLSRRASEQFLRAGYFAEGTNMMERVLEQAGVEVRRTPLRAIASLVRHRRWLAKHGLAARPPSERADPVRTPDPKEARAIDALASGAMGLSVVDSVRSADMMSEALRRSLEAGDRTRLASALGWWTAFVANEGGPAEKTTRSILATAREETAAHGDAYARGCLCAAAGMTEFHLGHFGEARAHFERGVRVFEEETHGTTKEASTLHIFHHATLAVGGRLDELAQRTEERVRISEARGERYALVNYRQGLMILRWLAIGAPERAEEDLARAMDGFGASGFVVQHWFDVWGHIALMLYRDQRDAARALWEKTRPRLVASLLLRTQFTRTQSFAMEAVTAAARLEAGGLGPIARAQLGAWGRAAASRARGEDRPWARAIGALLEACMLGAYGESKRARALLEETLPALESTELGLYAALAHERLGVRDPAHRARAEAWAEAEGVTTLEPLARAILPGLSRLG